MDVCVGAPVKNPVANGSLLVWHVRVDVVYGCMCRRPCKETGGQWIPVGVARARGCGIKVVNRYSGSVGTKTLCRGKISCTFCTNDFRCMQYQCSPISAVEFHVGVSDWQQKRFDNVFRMQ